jgi:hypothetical protein
VKRIFVSYRREDTAELVRVLTDGLKWLLARDRFFLDVTIVPSSSFVEALDKALDACDAALVVIGPQWFGVGQKGQRRLDDVGDFVRMEVERLLARNVPLIPVLVHGAQMPAHAELPPAMASLAERQAVVLSNHSADTFPQPVVDALLRILRRWRPLAIRDETRTITWSHSWRDIAWLTDTEGWLCGAVTEGGAGGHVGYGILLRTTDGGATWWQAENILSGRGEFNWGGYRYNWTEVGPIYSILLYPRERTEGEEIVNGYIVTMTGVYRAAAPRSLFTHEVEWRRSTPDPGGAVPFTHFGSLVSIEGDNELYAAGWPGIANCVRGGTWTLQMKTFTYPIGMVAVAGGSDNRSVWAVGRAGQDDFGNWGSESHGALYHLEWPANRWQRVPLPGIDFEEAQNLLGLHVVDRSHLFVVGDKGLVLHGRRERGNAWVWRKVLVPSQAALYGVTVNEFGLWVIGANSTILNSVDGGHHWTTLDVPDVETSLMGIRFHGATGWILGHGVVLKYD